MIYQTQIVFVEYLLRIFLPCLKRGKLTLPKFFIVIPTYNRDSLLPKAIESVLQQKYDEFTIIIIDDGSNDNTEIIVQNFIKKYSYLILYQKQENGGVCSARNSGITKALEQSENIKNEYIFFLGDDDELVHNSLNRIAESIIKYPKIQRFLFQTIDQDGRKTSWVKGDDLILDYKEVVKSEKFGGEMHPIMRLNLFLNPYYRFNENVNGGESILWLKISKRVKTRAINRITYLIHNENISLSRQYLNSSYLLNAYKIYYILLRGYESDFYVWNKKRLASLYMNLAICTALLRNKKMSFIYFTKSIKLFPKNYFNILRYSICLFDRTYKINNHFTRKIKGWRD
ncbi:MAG: glycosyltransferase family 2 protein [Candidatus Lokiarchaeota archaeon]|nr:glycosyltransferase family 2 protein [Candidatus Lokiarchaeota archaeon]